MEIQIIRNEGMSSYEVGKAGNRLKVYFEEPSDLKRKLAELKLQGVFDGEEASGY